MKLEEWFNTKYSPYNDVDKYTLTMNGKKYTYHIKIAHERTQYGHHYDRVIVQILYKNRIIRTYMPHGIENAIISVMRREENGGELCVTEIDTLDDETKNFIGIARSYQYQ